MIAVAKVLSFIEHDCIILRTDCHAPSRGDFAFFERIPRQNAPLFNMATVSRYIISKAPVTGMMHPVVAGAERRNDTARATSSGEGRPSGTGAAFS